MSDDTPPPPADALIGQLERAGFFRQVGDLERTLKRVAGDIKRLGDATGTGETASLAAHILALEAAVTVLMRAVPGDVDALPLRLVRGREGEDSAGP